MEIHHRVSDCGPTPLRKGASHNIEPLFPRFLSLRPPVELFFLFDSSLGCFATCLSKVAASPALAALQLFPSREHTNQRSFHPSTVSECQHSSLLAVTRSTSCPSSTKVTSQPSNAAREFVSNATAVAAAALVSASLSGFASLSFPSPGFAALFHFGAQSASHSSSIPNEVDSSCVTSMTHTSGVTELVAGVPFKRTLNATWSSRIMSASC